MRHISKWAHMMSSSVTIAERTGVDGYGKPTYGTAVAYRAHIARKRQLVRTEGGEQVESMQAIYLMGSPAVQPSARITLSTADVGSTEAFAITPVIKAAERRSDGGGPHHTVVYL